MKKKNREISIFSMSALDLFASALGAFILLVVIALPYFGNTSPRDPGFQQMPKLDLVVVLDITGSMGGEIDALKRELADIVKILDKLSESAAIRVIVFGDDNFDNPMVPFPLIETVELATLQDIVNGIYINMGIGRGSNSLIGEAVYAGTKEALNTTWREGALRKILIITDDVPHTYDVQRLNADVRSFAGMSEKNRLSVFFVSRFSSANAYYIDLADMGNGIYLDYSSSSSLTAALILSLLP